MVLYSRHDGLRTRNLDSAAKCSVGMEVFMRSCDFSLEGEELKKAVAASVLMRRHSDEPMAKSGMEWTSEIGILWESLMEFLLQVYICC